MAEPSMVDSEVDALSGLEERIQKAVMLVGSLRKDRDSLTRELAEAQSENQRLAHEIDAIRQERAQVRTRIEKLLGHIDQLSL